MGLPMNARFGLDSTPDTLDGRELMLIQGALGSMRRYHLGLAQRNKDHEAAGRNIVNALEVKVLMEKLEKAFSGS